MMFTSVTLKTARCSMRLILPYQQEKQQPLLGPPALEKPPSLTSSEDFMKSNQEKLQ